MSQYLQPDILKQIRAWLQGLSAISWADGDFNPDERALIASFVLDSQSLAPYTAAPSPRPGNGIENRWSDGETFPELR
jgi:hypothetical protein